MKLGTVKLMMNDNYANEYLKWYLDNHKAHRCDKICTAM